MSPTKTELEEGLAKAEAKVARLERRLSENTRSPEVVDSGDRIAQIETLINEEIAENPDTGDGTYTHLVGIQSAVAAYRDSARAWQHIADPPLLARGQVRDDERAEAASR